LKNPSNKITDLDAKKHKKIVKQQTKKIRMQERRTNKIGRKNDENINERKKENRNIHLLRLSGTKELLSRNKMERNVRCSFIF
jgi:hypothetical protein